MHVNNRKVVDVMTPSHLFYFIFLKQ